MVRYKMKLNELGILAMVCQFAAKSTILTLTLGIGILSISATNLGAAESQENQPKAPAKMSILISPPIQYPPETIKFKGKPAAIAAISSFGSGGYSIKVNPLPEAPKGIKSGEITCNKGILVLQFNPKEEYTGVLQSCPQNAKVSIVLK